MREVLRIIAGNICITGAYAFITVPCHIVNGGITSFSMILHNFINMDISFFTNAITILLLILCFFQLGKSFLLKSLLSSICYMLFFSIFYALDIVFPLPMPLAVLMASVMVGFGYYLCISSNSSTVGFDVLAIILHNKNDSFPIAVTMRYINVIVVLLGFASYGWKSVLIGIVFPYFQTQLLHLLLKRHEKMIQCGNKVTASVSTCIVENERMTQ